MGKMAHSFYNDLFHCWYVEFAFFYSCWESGASADVHPLAHYIGGGAAIMQKVAAKSSAHGLLMTFT